MNNQFINFYNKLKKEHTILLLVLYMAVWVDCELLLPYRGLIIILLLFIRSFLVFLIVNLKKEAYTSAICGLIAFFINCIYFVFFHHIELSNYYIVSGRITEKIRIQGRSSSRDVYYSYYLDGKEHKSKKDTKEVIFDQVEVGDVILIRLDEKLEWSTFIQDSACVNYYTTGKYFSKPVKYVNKQEFGNDYYYYAKLNPTLALKNFGLNRVFMGLGKNDSLLVYKNINDSIEFKTVHICADTLQTAANRALVGDTFAFLFHDGIYTKEQVFEEIPEAKEYYYKYYKESE